MKIRPLARMLEARSVAVVGASARPGSFGEQLMLQLVRGGFDGAVHPVNPNYREVLGHRCLPSIADLPDPVDLAILGVGNAALESQLAAAAKAQAAAAVIFASAWEAPEPGVPALTERLRAIAVQAGMSLCGPNGMGFVNVERRLRACGYLQPGDLRAGRVAFVTHSGSAFSAMLHNRRGLAFNLVVSSGSELVTGLADYLEHMLDLDSTRAVGLFMEVARDPAALTAALAKAAAADVPVVALKVGRSSAARALVTAHAGVLAGDDAAYEALFEAAGVLRVDTLDELADTLELLAPGRRAGPGGLAVVHDSGGERALVADHVAAARVPMAQIGESTRRRLEPWLAGGLAPENPLDAWGRGEDADEVLRECLLALADDPDTAALAFCVDLTTEEDPAAGYPLIAREVAERTTKPVVVLSNMASAIDPREAATVRAAGIPLLEGTATGLAALRHLFELRDAGAARAPAVPQPGVGAEVRARWAGRLARARAPLPEVEALALLGDYGVPAVRAEAAGSVEQALAAAGRIGWPVALKTAAPGIAHKSDVGGVELGLAGPAALLAAYERLAARHGRQVLVARMVPAGVELALGAVHDPAFGPLLVVAFGGVLVEVVRDRRCAFPPLDHARALALLDRLAARPLLDGVRGAPPADIRALADAVVRFSVLAADLGEHLHEVDVNPLIAGARGCVAVDALVVPRPR